MNRAEFMRRLSELLYDVSPSEREEAIQYYNDYFDDAGAENEQSVIISLGTPEQVAGTIKAGLFDGGNTGEFTEKGFSSQTQINENEIIDPQKAYNKENTYSQQNSYSQQNNYNQQNGYSRQNDYSQQNSYGKQKAYSQQDNYKNQNNGYNQQNTGGSQPNNKKPMSGKAIALIVLLCILASPFLLGLFGSIAGIVIGFFGAIFGIVVGLGAASIALLIVGICLFVYGITLIFTIPLGGLCMMGGALICAAIGLVLLWLVGLICAGLIPASVRALVSLAQRLFHNRGGAKA